MRSFLEPESPSTMWSRPTTSSLQQVAEWVRSGCGGEGEQVGSEGWAGGFSGESGDALVGLVELRHGLGSGELFGG